MRRAGAGRRLLLAAASAFAALAAAANAPTDPSPREPLTPAQHRRSADQTFLTFPEWYLVHSPAEYAAFLAGAAAGADRPSGFPLFAHIGQFWRGYAAVNGEIAKFPFNGGYHVMVMVIGTSTTVEYALKGVYEHTIGRLAEASASATVPEERFAAHYAQAYVDFIRVEPWYKFDFASELQRLWSDVPRSGPNLMRRWERRFALTTELLVKEAYARLIKVGTQAAYDAPEPVTAVVLTKAPHADASHPAFVTLAADPGAVLATIPRYEEFSVYSRWLASQGVDFVEIAGNRGDVALSVLADSSWRPRSPARLLFTQPIITRPGRQRFVVAAPVRDLATLLRAFEAQPRLAIEHIYDF